MPRASSSHGCDARILNRRARPRVPAKRAGSTAHTESMAHVAIRIGTAGWNIPRQSGRRFASSGTHLQRYAHAFTCVEINSAFYRSHRPATYARWAASVPDDFRFAIKLTRTITHDMRLQAWRAPLDQFLSETAALGEKRGPILVQLPPSLAYSDRVVQRFFEGLRRRHDGPVVCEPRHPTWFTRAVERVLVRYAVGRVAADPQCGANGDCPAGWAGLQYFRWHGSPRMYWSGYDAAALAALALRLRAAAARGSVYCIFDNTAAGFAADNALDLRAALT